MKRFEARFFRSVGAHWPVVARVCLALVALGSGAWSLVATRAALSGGPSDFAGQALSIFSNGALTFEVAPRFVGLLEIAFALAVALLPSARTAVVLAMARVVLSIAPLVQLQDALWTRYPTQLNGAGQSALAAVVWWLGAFAWTCQQRWELLEAQPDVRELLEETPYEAALRARKWRRFGAVFGILTLVTLGAVGVFGSRASHWFHERQEAAVFDEVLAGKLSRKSMPASEFLHGRKITIWVYLPPGYEMPGKRFPTIYVMHGMPGEVRDPFVKGRIQDTADQLIVAKKIEPVILIGWDGQGPGGPADVTNFLNRPDYPMESFITHELVPYVDRTYKTLPDPRFRALDGISAGGYAAPNFLFKHPNVWGVASSHTGFFSPEDDANNMTNILGPRGPKWDGNDPTKNAARFGPQNDVHLYLDIGQGDDLVPEFGKFVSLLKSRGIDHEAHVFPGRHTWGYWSAHFSDSLLFADQRFRDAREADALGKVPQKNLDENAASNDLNESSPDANGMFPAPSPTPAKQASP